MTTSQLFLLLESNTTSSPQVSHARTSQLPEPETDLDWTENVRDFSTKLSASFASADPPTSSWKTSQPCLLATTGEIWQQYSGSFPRAGTMRSGKLYQRPPLVRITSARDCGLLPTPRASDNCFRIGKNIGKCKNGGFYLQTTKGKSAAYTTSVLDYLKRPDLATSPSFRELMMGYPVGWTKVSGECESKH